MRIYQFQGRPTDAQNALQELIVRAPDDANLHLQVAVTFVAQNDLKSAREELETSLRLGPGNPDAFDKLGAVLLRMGLTQDALARFEKCRLIAPDFDHPVINAALAYTRTGEPDKARQVLTEFFARHPENARVREALEKKVR